MSLSRHLQAKDSLLKAFFDERLPKTRSFVTKLNKELKQYPLIVSSPDDAKRSGTAIDYRIRYYYGITPNEELVAYRGAGLLQGDPRWETHMQRLRPLFFDALTEALDRIKPVGRCLDDDEEELLTRYCLVLTQFEVVARAGLQYVSPFVGDIAAGRMATVNGMLASAASDATVEDVRLLSRDFYERQYSSLNRSPMVLNPKFEGSRDVGGGDADIVAGDSLIEIKSGKTNILGWHLHQVLGYACLDYGDEYKIRRLGLSILRRGVLKEWSGDELVDGLSGGALSYDALRAEAATHFPTMFPREPLGGHKKRRGEMVLRLAKDRRTVSEVEALIDEYADGHSYEERRLPDLRELYPDASEAIDTWEHGSRGRKTSLRQYKIRCQNMETAVNLGHVLSKVDGVEILLLRVGDSVG